MRVFVDPLAQMLLCRLECHVDSGSHFRARTPAEPAIAHSGMPETPQHELRYPVQMPIETKRTESGVAIITVTGRLVIGKEVEKLESSVNDLLVKNQKTIVLDLTGLEYADSSGIGTFVSCLSAVRKAGGEMRMA